MGPIDSDFFAKFISTDLAEIERKFSNEQLVFLAKEVEVNEEEAGNLTFRQSRDTMMVRSPTEKEEKEPNT